VVSLAVLEHVENPLDFMFFLKSLLAENGKIVITTPHPHSEAIHSLGSKIGLFSSHAHQEHKKLFDAHNTAELINLADIEIVTGKTFLFGMNQLFVLGFRCTAQRGKAKPCGGVGIQEGYLKCLKHGFSRHHSREGGNPENFVRSLLLAY
jgi:hypothetical protein